jgi:hypothetical protein
MWLWLWSWEANGRFTTNSVYQVHFNRKITCDFAAAIWKTWAPLRCKVATWLFVRRRVWIAVRLSKRGLPHIDKCVLCNAADENAHHLFTGCAVVNII